MISTDYKILMILVTFSRTLLTVEYTSIMVFRTVLVNICCCASFAKLFLSVHCGLLQLFLIQT